MKQIFDSAATIPSSPACVTGIELLNSCKKITASSPRRKAVRGVKFHSTEFGRWRGHYSGTRGFSRVYHQLADQFAGEFQDRHRAIDPKHPKGPQNIRLDLAEEKGRQQTEPLEETLPH